LILLHSYLIHRTAKLTDRRLSVSSGLAAGVLGGGSVQRLVRRAIYVIYVKPV